MPLEDNFRQEDLDELEERFEKVEQESATKQHRPFDYLKDLDFDMPDDVL